MMAVELLRVQMDEVYQRLHHRLAGLTDAEYFWQPAPGCWTVHQGSTGAWTCDYTTPDPDPPPLTTIAWRLAHLTQGKTIYHNHGFGPASLTFADVTPAATAAHAIADLDTAHTALRADLDQLTDTDLDTPRPTLWGQPWPGWRIFWTMIDHDDHHGAEIACLRDLYRALGTSQ